MDKIPCCVPLLSSRPLALSAVLIFDKDRIRDCKDSHEVVQNMVLASDVVCLPLMIPNLSSERLATGKYGCAEVRVYPAECGEQLGTDPSKIGSSKSLVFKSFFSGEWTLGDSSLPVSLTLWDTPALLTPPLPLPQNVLPYSSLPSVTKRIPTRINHFGVN